MEIFSQLFCKTKVTGVIGFLAVNPPCHDLHVMASFLPAFLPTLVVLSLHDSQQSEKERYLFISLPNVVVVHHNNQLDGYEWGRWTENDATLKSGPIPYTYLLWLVRLIAQYSEVIASLDQEDNFLQDICVGRTDENSKLTSRL